jgi:TonB family protein
MGGTAVNGTIALPGSEMMGLRSRQRRCLATSIVAHILLFCWLVLAPHDRAEPLGIVEIAWLEPAPEPAPPASSRRPAPSPEPTAIPSVRERPAVKFRRLADDAEVEPRPQDSHARQDRLDERLASLRRLETRPPALASAAEPTSRWSNMAVAGAAGTSTSPPRELTRDKQGSGQALALNREPTRGRAPVLATTPPPAAARETAPMAGQTTTASRTLAGVTLAGAVADRPVKTHVLPEYPAWAMREAVEATVTLLFVVLPDGRVKENVQVQKTAGYSDFDDNAVAALLRWRFAPLSGGGTEEQWGTITFRYRLRDARQSGSREAGKP